MTDVLFHFVLTGPDLVVPRDDLEVGGGGLDALHRPLHIPLRGVDLKKQQGCVIVWTYVDIYLSLHCKKG